MLAKAHELLNQMQTEGVQPNAHTFTTIINACTQANDLDRGLLVRRTHCMRPRDPRLASDPTDCSQTAAVHSHAPLLTPPLWPAVMPTEMPTHSAACMPTRRDPMPRRLR